MRSTIFALVCGLALVVGPIAARAATFQDTGARVADHTLRERIETRVERDTALKTHDIKVSVEGGVATLTGTVSTRKQRERAAQLARVTGIARVDNQIVVDRSASTTGTKGTVDNAKDAAKEVGGAAKDGAIAVGEKSKEGAEAVGEKTKEGAAKVGDKALGGVNKASDGISDTAIVTRVKSRFVGEELLKGSDIKVDCDKHVVTLRGTVASAAGRARAVEIANGIDSVEHVINELTIGPKERK
jgi:hyperosmotically inducible periplasmic protein